MPDTRRRGGGDERETYLTKIAGSAAAFILLVMWMIPPTTPRVDPSPLAAFENIRSDAPTKDPLAGPGDFSALAAPIPWSDLRLPAPKRIDGERIEGPAFVWPDDPAPVETSAAVERAAPVVIAPPPPILERSENAPQPIDEPRQTWVRTESKASEDSVDARLEDER